MNIDALFVISLDTDTKRRELMKSWYPPGVLNFHIVKRMKDPTHGCYNSHEQILMKSKQMGLQRVLILEDDAFPLFDWDKIVRLTNKAIQELESTAGGWTFLALGYLPIRTTKTRSNNLVRINCAFGTHAYIANVPKFKHVPFKGIPIDSLLFCNVNNKTQLKHTKFKTKQGFFGVYGILPMLFTQKSDTSTIDNSHVLFQTWIKVFGNEQEMIRASMYVNTLYVPMIICMIIILLLALFIYFACNFEK